MQDMMDLMDIAFPHLGIYLRNVPKSFTVFGFTIALYGVIIAASMLLGIVMAAHMGKKTGQNPDDYWDISLWIIISAIAGARIYYVIFFWDSYKNNLLEIFNLRGGGLAIYGGIILSVITIFVYCRIKKKNAFLMLDTTSFGLVLGQITGRWGNFFNREVFGEYTDSLLAMRIPAAMVRERDISPLIAEHMTEGINYIQVHPTFLYESLWNCGVLLLMLLFYKKKCFDGEVLLLYLTAYGIGRAWIEYIRTDQLYITGTKVPVSMVLGIAMAVGSVVLDVVVRTWRRKKQTPAAPEEAAQEMGKTE
ncbi:MAG: prolipoprotein diacylglyceryl transferase [Lachnospiraceae bacterium]|nr:prolipoprotein diacylglyceryl transferase [Lachnospiraceae bacterium]